MEKLNLQTEIEAGKDIESRLLFDGAGRKIMQITLRRNQILKAHQAAEPITIQCVAGAGERLDASENEIYKLSLDVLNNRRAENCSRSQGYAGSLDFIEQVQERLENIKR